MIEGYYIANPTTPEERAQNRLVTVLQRAIISGDLSFAEAASVVEEIKSRSVELGQLAASQELSSEQVPSPEELAAEQMLTTTQKINHPTITYN